MQILFIILHEIKRKVNRSRAFLRKSLRKKVERGTMTLKGEDSMNAFYERRPDEMSVFHADSIQFPAHFHESLELFYAIEDGHIVWAGGREQKMRPGDLALLFPGTIHAYNMVEGVESSSALLAVVPLNLTGEFRQILAEMHPETPFLPAESLHPDVDYAFHSLEKPEDPPNLRARRVLVQLILSRALPFLNLQKKSGEPTIVYQLVDILSREYREQLTLDGLSKRLGVSRYTLSRIFSEQIGCGFPEYVNRLRLGEAENLLSNTSLPITEISYRCGFETPRTFNRAFRSQLGVTPREYRGRKE